MNEKPTSLALVPPGRFDRIKQAQLEARALSRVELTRILRDLEASLEQADELAPMLDHAGTRDVLLKLAKATRDQITTVRQIAERNP